MPSVASCSGGSGTEPPSRLASCLAVSRSHTLIIHRVNLSICLGLAMSLLALPAYHGLHCRSVTSFLLSHIGLLSLVVGYCIMGAFIFQVALLTNDKV